MKPKLRIERSNGGVWEVCPNKMWSPSGKNCAEVFYIKLWEKKSTKEIEAEIKSWQKYFDKNSSIYNLGKREAPPSELADGDKVCILKEILRKRQEVL